MTEPANMLDGRHGPLYLLGILPGDEGLFWLLVALLATVVMFGTFCTFLLIRRLSRLRLAEGRDFTLPWHPFRGGTPFVFPGDYPCRWLAIRGASANAVLESLKLSRRTPCSWQEGLARMFDRQLFVSPPLNGWILVLGAALPDPAEDVDVCFRFLGRLSAELGHVQFFNMNRALAHHAWAILDRGQVVRAYAWAGQTLWNQGELTSTEKKLNLRCLDYTATGPREDSPDFALMAANTDKVPLLAAQWSLDPVSVARKLMPERRGVAGEPPLPRRV